MSSNALVYNPSKYSLTFDWSKISDRTDTVAVIWILTVTDSALCLVIDIRHTIVNHVTDGLNYNFSSSIINIILPFCFVKELPVAGVTSSYITAWSVITLFSQLWVVKIVLSNKFDEELLYTAVMYCIGYILVIIIWLWIYCACIDNRFFTLNADMTSWIYLFI